MNTDRNDCRVTILDTGENFLCSSTESVLHGLARLGKRGIPVGCRGGGCGVCKIEVVSGSFDKKPMSRSHVSEQDEARQHVLACRIWPRGDLALRVSGPMHKAILRQGALPGGPLAPQIEPAAATFHAVKT